MLIAQISDLHVRPTGQLAYGVSETNLFAEHAIHALLRLDPTPDCLLVTGDLTDCGLDEEYAIVAELLARMPCPVYAVPGNHDRREPLRRAFAQKGYLPENGPLNFAAWCGPVQIIGLDSLVAGSSHGALAPETLGFVEQTLAASPDAPTIIMLHHPPFNTGIAHMDATRLFEGSEQLERIVEANHQVRRVLCGHVHRSIQRMFGGALCQIAPSVGHQVTLDLRPDGPSCFVLEAPEFLLHRFEDDDVVTHTAKVDRAPGPFPFILPQDYPGGSRESSVSALSSGA
ncbi:phosphodiesterase [Mesorhizobium sp. VK22B]|uniref:Phosphodiesterase n=1 Tax=Mesorhizobium captivum TaxID=3072319 RepID=A0ABU4YZS9_9HYPH|nr:MULTISPECIES: phosphodiesterase [unclassified Mesorhizobium]MDX8492479.1 phosphodiesterase [Mesorhizobium sp. VK22B]MDX8505568.1 phosphodiesterase [Mesorhizobium sp. VK22E]